MQQRKKCSRGKGIAVESKMKKWKKGKNRSAKWKRLVKTLNREAERKRDFYL